MEYFDFDTFREIMAAIAITSELCKDGYHPAHE
jgi:hypothetical protein